MKNAGFLLFWLFLLTSLSCKTENEKKLNNPQNNKKKSAIVITRTKSVLSTKKIKSLIDNNKNYEHLFQSFNQQKYSVEELIDIVKQDLDYIKSIRQSPTIKKIDTASVTSRLTLAEINLKKINFLLHKNNPKQDTIQKTLNAIIKNFNNAIYQINLYNVRYDEFQDLINMDSIQRAKEDSLRNESKKIQKPNLKKIDFKLKKLF